MGVTVSSSHVVSSAPSSSGKGLLTLFPCSSMRSLPQETVLHKLLQHESFPQVAALHELPQCGSFPPGSGTGCSSMGPHGVTSPASKPAPAWAPLSVGPQVLAGACSSAGSPWGHSLLQAPACSGVGSLPWTASGYLLHHEPPWAAGRQPASPWSSSCAVRENSLLQNLKHLLLPPSSLTLVSAVVSLTLSHSSLSTAVSLQFFFLPLLKYVITEALPPSLIGLALASGRSILEPAGTGFIRHGGRFLQLLTEATTIAPPLPKPCHANP